jgi:hypothetical protein
MSERAERESDRKNGARASVALSRRRNSTKLPPSWRKTRSRSSSSPSARRIDMNLDPSHRAPISPTFSRTSGASISGIRLERKLRVIRFVNLNRLQLSNSTNVSSGHEPDKLGSLSLRLLCRSIREHHAKHLPSCWCRPGREFARALPQEVAGPLDPIPRRVHAGQGA